MIKKKVCAVICNYNKRDDVLNAVASIFASSLQGIEILVVDNASTDDSCEALRETFGERIELLSLPENTGGSGGFAAGMQRAAARDSDYVLLLDNDARVLKTTIAELVAIMESDADCAVLAPAILLDDGSELVQECGGRLTEAFTFAPNFRRHEPDSLPRGHLECDYVPACCLLTRAETIRKVGCFDTNYFLYWDDIDWCNRVRIATRGSIRVAPDVRAYHKGGASTNPLSHYFHWRNRLRFFAARLDEEAWQDFVRTISFEATRAILHTALSGRLTTANAIADALHDAANGVVGGKPPSLRALIGEVDSLPAPTRFKVSHVHALTARTCPEEQALADSYGNFIPPLPAKGVAQLTQLASEAAALVGAALTGAKRHATNNNNRKSTA